MRKTTTDAQSFHSVTALTLSSIWKRIEKNIKYINCLKVDIEGAEVFVLNQLTKEIADSIGSIIIETHSEYNKKLASRVLKDFGFLQIDSKIINAECAVSFWSKSALASFKPE